MPAGWRDYGPDQHAKTTWRLLDLFEAGSYYHKDKQLAQLKAVYKATMMPSYWAQSARYSLITTPLA